MVRVHLGQFLLLPVSSICWKSTTCYRPKRIHELSKSGVFFLRFEFWFLSQLLVDRSACLSVMKYLKVNNGDYILSIRCWSWKQNSTSSCVVKHFSFVKNGFEVKSMNCSFVGYAYIQAYKMPASDRKWNLHVGCSIDVEEFSCIVFALLSLSNKEGYFDSIKSMFCMFLFEGSAMRKWVNVCVSHVKKWVESSLAVDFVN